MGLLLKGGETDILRLVSIIVLLKVPPKGSLWDNLVNFVPLPLLKKSLSWLISLPAPWIKMELFPLSYLLPRVLRLRLGPGVKIDLLKLC
jgi:hypothetical protein